MSDVSGPGVASEGIAYLTGYPLSDAGVYALAKTWPAPEMSRPGCVWTHTLYIDFADLGRITCPSQIAEHFIRPDAHNFRQYSQTLSVELDDFSTPFGMEASQKAWLSEVLAGLYEKPLDKVLIRRESNVDVDASVLRVWDQQWPRLRRSFRFCTLTSRDRSNEYGEFDLQVLQAHSTNSRTNTYLPPVQTEWLSTLVRDIAQPSNTGLRQTLRVLGAETQGGREAMATLCNFHALLENDEKHLSIDATVASLESISLLNQSKYARAEVAKLALHNIANANKNSLTFVIDNLSSLEPSLVQEKCQSLANILWRHFPEKLWELISSNESVSKIMLSAVKEIPVESILSGFREMELSYSQLLKIRPDLLSSEAFWKLAQIDPALIISEDSEIDMEVVIVAMLRGLKQENPIASAVRLFGSTKILFCMLMAKHSHVRIARESYWLRFSCLNTSAVASFLTDAHIHDERMLEALSFELSPESIPNEYGHDPWFIALSNLKNNTGTLSIRLVAYAFRRALGWRSRSVGELLSLSFESLHASLERSELDDENWNLIEDRLPWVPSYRRWDRCLRIRQIVVETFVSKDLHIQTFLDITIDQDLFLKMLETTLDTLGGYRYLKKIEAFVDQDNFIDGNVQKILRNFMKKNRRIW
ncbi:hypothetical protein H0Z17_14520 [Herbaspirillum sp. AP21]|nr:hypothetical protein [Herbaspirillum sp. AP21]